MSEETGSEFQYSELFIGLPMVIGHPAQIERFAMLRGVTSSLVCAPNFTKSYRVTVGGGKCALWPSFSHPSNLTQQSACFFLIYPLKMILLTYSYFDVKVRPARMNYLLIKTQFFNPNSSNPRNCDTMVFHFI